MASLDLNLWGGSYPFTPETLARQLQASWDGFANWSNVGDPFTGSAIPVASDLVGKCVRVIETVTAEGQQYQTSTNVIGPVELFNALASTPLAAGEKLWAIGDSQLGYR